MPAKMWCRDECSSKILGFFEDLWLALVRKYKFPDEWVFFFGGSLSLFTTNCRKAGHTTYNTLLLFLLLLFLLAAFFSFWNMKKNYCGLTKWLQHMKIWHETTLRLIYTCSYRFVKMGNTGEIGRQLFLISS